jgi:hypothetical protein
MSHLTTKIFNESPNVRGEFTSKNIQDLAGYPGSILDGQTLVYNASTQSWEGGELVSGTDYPLAAFGRGESDDYINCGVSIAKNNIFCLYDTDPLNKMPQNVTFNYITGTNWLESVTLSPGKYEIWTNLGCIFSSTGYLKYCWRNSSGERVSNEGIIGELYGKSSYCLGFVDSLVEETINISITGVANTSAALQGNFPSTRSFMSIRGVI